MRKSVLITIILLVLVLFTNACTGGSEKTDITTALGNTEAPLNQEQPQSTQPDTTTAVDVETTTGQHTTVTPDPVTTTRGAVVAVVPIPISSSAIYGERTGTQDTYTGLEPLPLRDFTAQDPQNTRGLSNTAVNHSYGVSKNALPHQTSVKNQAYFEKFGAFTLDQSGAKVIYLTFDCGYENGYTEVILDVLKEKGVPAAFFVTGTYLKSAPQMVARMINDGHVVGNHSDKHANFSTVSRDRMALELKGVDDVLRTKFGYSSPFFRFPEGAYSENALDLVRSLGYESVFWSSAYADWDTSKQKGKEYAFSTVTSRLHPGCVLLLHSVSRDNAEAMADIIDWAKAQGYEFKAL
ncbi:MAG: polysaccharide deacetylase family protein [Clostridiales bacterium]|nr:polysaccharide deacetylase family protein [Clostridiales bacterium]